MSNENEDDGRLSSMEVALYYGVSLKTFESWRQDPEFPRSAGKRRGGSMFWDLWLVDEYLKDRLARRTSSTRGVKPRWADAVA